jgi:phage RecT family recombinase
VSGSSASAPIVETPEVKGLPALLNHVPVVDRIKPFLPKGVSYERVVAAAIMAGKNNPAILRCKPESIITAVAKITQWGLEIGETAHLVPFGDICTPIADYKGLAQLMVASGAVRHVEAVCVYEGDEFHMERGTNASIRHIPTHQSTRGAMTGCYVILRLPFQNSAFDYMSVEDIDAIRQARSKQWKSGPLPAWYAKKTVVRQVAKMIPKDPRLAQAMRALDEDAELELDETPAAPALASGAEIAA